MMEALARDARYVAARATDQSSGWGCDFRTTPHRRRFFRWPGSVDPTQATAPAHSEAQDHG